MMSESKFWKMISKNISHRGHFNRIESPLMSTGFPDVDFCVNAVEGKIELKYGKGCVPSIRPTQVSWHNKRADHGGKTWIFSDIHIDDIHYYCLHRGIKIKRLATTKSVVEWLGSADHSWKNKIDWDKFLNIIGGNGRG